MVVNFSDDLYSQLSEGSDTSPEVMRFKYPPWDILNELDRRERRGQIVTERDRKVREYIREHPEVVERLRKQGKLK
jgi:hypothetical protein